MTQCIIVAQNANGSKGGTQNQKFEVFSFEREVSFFQQNRGCKKEGNQISEKTFLDRIDISGKLNKQVHQSEGKGGDKDKKNAFLFI